MHIRCDNALRKSRVRYSDGIEMLGNDASHATTKRQDGIRDNAHQAYRRSSINESDVTFGEVNAKVVRDCGMRRKKAIG